MQDFKLIIRKVKEKPGVTQKYLEDSVKEAGTAGTEQQAMNCTSINSIPTHHSTFLY